MELRRVVVTGMGAVSPNGTGREAFWRATAGGVSGTAPITLFDASKLSCRVAAEVKDFDFDRYLGKKDKDRVQRAVPMAFFGMLLNFAEADSWTMARPRCSFTDLTPNVPSVPIPDRMTATARSP